MTQIRDIAIINAVVRTVDDRDSTASAVLLRRGIIKAVGTAAEILSVADSDVETVDVGGRTVVPGFIDAHNHMSVAAFAPITADCSTPPLSTMDEVLEVIRKHCQAAPHGQWVMAQGFHKSHIREQRNPNRHELDEVAPNNPVYLMDMSGHAGYTNSYALAAAGISAHSPQPWGGTIEFGADGKPTGTLLEAAVNWISSAAWASYAERDWDRAVDLLHAKAQEYLAAGLTGIGDACVTPKASELFHRAAAAGRLPLTVQQIHAGDHFFAMQDLRRSDFLERVTESDSHMLRGNAIKIFFDKAYPQPAMDQIHDGCSHHVGASFYTSREITELAKGAAELGLDTAVHGIGNCAIDAVLDAYEAARRSKDKGSTFRIEHAFVAETRQGSRMAELGVDLVANPGLVWHWGEYFNAWRGDDQPHLQILPLRSMIDAGVRLSLASDYPCGPFEPAHIVSSAVTRMSLQGVPIEPDEAITAAEALRAFTINAAHASGRADEEGSIEVGKRANILVLDRDIVTCPSEDIRGMRVDQTYVDGCLVYESEDQRVELLS